MRPKALLLILGAALVAAADGKKMDPVRIPAIVDLNNAKCPVQGEDVDKESHFDWNGVRIQLCCPDCKPMIEKEPRAALEKLGLKVAKDADGKTVVDLGNATCPIMNKPVKPDVTGDLDGVRMRFCCAGCDKKLRKDPAAAYAKLGYGYIPAVIDLRNTTCPISGKPAGADFADADGIRVHLCGPDCAAEFQKDPKGTFAKMAVDPAKLKETVK
jgi:hypothetical protein